jgi:outer membrane receptor protein involved in Fe transport
MARFRTCAVVVALFVATPCIGWAQEDEDDLDDIESLVVTARRRPEFLQETPVAATVLGGELLEQRGVNSIEDIGVYVPNLTSISGAQRQGSFFQRGVGQRDAIVTLDPTSSASRCCADPRARSTARTRSAARSSSCRRSRRPTRTSRAR